MPHGERPVLRAATACWTAPWPVCLLSALCARGCAWVHPHACRYVVTRVVLKYKLVSGRYVRDHNGLEVTPTGRFFMNMMLDGLVKRRYVGPTGPQD